MNEQHEDALSGIKRPPNAFLLYMKEMRISMQDELHNKNNLEITKIISEKWKNLSNDEKIPYKNRATELATDFKKDHPEYNYKKARKKKIISKITDTIAENPLLEAQIVSGQFGSDVFQYPYDPEVFFLFSIGNRFLERAFRGKA